MSPAEREACRELLERKYLQFNHPDFIETDPISIPHLFNRKEDIEISGFLAAIIAWGQRRTILQNGQRLMHLMDYAPFDFLMQAESSDLKPFEQFVHRTFNGIDCVYFIRALQQIYRHYGGLEGVFQQAQDQPDLSSGIIRLRTLFFSFPGYQPRTGKHLPDITRQAAAKRLNMFLRWMIRNDHRGVDFGLWKTLKPAQLFCPLDVHTGRVARGLGLLERKQDNWKAVLELTEQLRTFDSDDPVKYDFALYGMGVFDRFPGN